MPTETTNYKLKKPLSSEKYDVEIFNENADKIEAGMLANYQAIQTKQNTITGSATTITSATLTKDRVVITNSSGKIAVSDITSTELGYLDGVTSNVQTQINSVASSVTSEASTRASADTTLQGKIDAEASARSSADTTLQSNIDKKVGKSGNETIEGTKTFTTIPVVTKSTSSTATGTQLTTADWVIGKVNASATTLEGKITTEATARASGDSALQGKIDAETTARGTAITNLQTTLQSNIDEKVSKSGDTMTGNLSINMELPRLYMGISKEGNYGDIIFSGADGKRAAVVRGIDGVESNNLILATIHPTTGTLNYALNINYDSNNLLNVTAPSWSVGTNDNSDKTLTIKMANSLPSLVHTTNNEMISGEKSFTNPIWRRIGDNRAVMVIYHTAAKGSTTTYYNDIVWRDESIYRAYIRCNLMPDGESIQLVPRNAEGGYGGEPLTVKWTSTNGMEVHVPYAPDNSNGVNAANTSWVRNRLLDYQKKVTVSTSAPSGGNDGDLWAVYE